MNKEQLNKVNLLNQEDSIIKQDYSEEPKKNNLIKLIITSIIVLIALIGGYFIYQYYFNQPIEEEQPITCSEETKTCPDGTTVVRIPPDCEFADCLKVTRDKQRIIHMLQINLGLAMYYSYNGHYPISKSLDKISGEQSILVQSLSPEYLNYSESNISPPLDPLHPDRYYGYISDGQGYKLTSYPENQDKKILEDLIKDYDNMSLEHKEGKYLVVSNIFGYEGMMNSSNDKIKIYDF